MSESNPDYLERAAVATVGQDDRFGNWLDRDLVLALLSSNSETEGGR